MARYDPWTMKARKHDIREWGELDASASGIPIFKLEISFKCLLQANFDVPTPTNPSKMMLLFLWLLHRGGYLEDLFLGSFYSLGFFALHLKLGMLNILSGFAELRCTKLDIHLELVARLHYMNQSNPLSCAHSCCELHSIGTDLCLLEPFVV